MVAKTLENLDEIINSSLIDSDDAYKKVERQRTQIITETYKQTKSENERMEKIREFDLKNSDMVEFNQKRDILDEAMEINYAYDNYTSIKSNYDWLLLIEDILDQTTGKKWMEKVVNKEEGREIKSFICLVNKDSDLSELTIDKLKRKEAIEDIFIYGQIIGEEIEYLKSLRKVNRRSIQNIKYSQINRELDKIIYEEFYKENYETKKLQRVKTK